MDFQASNLSTKIFLQVICIFGIVIFAYYEADLTTKMTISQQDAPLRSFTDILNTGKKLLVREGTTQLSIARNAKKGTALYNIYQNMDESNYIADAYCEYACIEAMLKVKLFFFRKCAFQLKYVIGKSGQHIFHCILLHDEDEGHQCIEPG